MQIVIDVETSVTPPDGWKEGTALKNSNNSPKLHSNELITIHTFDGVEAKTYVQPFNNFQEEVLDKITLFIGHNVKYDLMWLQECGFKYDGKLWDTQLVDYILTGQVSKFNSLQDLCQKYGLEDKKDILKEYFAKGINTNQIPIEELIEYGEHDAKITYQVYKKQLNQITNSNKPVVDLSNDFCYVLTQIERNGLAIDKNALDVLYKETSDKISSITERLGDIAYHTTGRNINLNSSQQLSELIYSIVIKDKKKWAEDFNFKPGQKPAHRIFALKKMSKKQFKTIVNANAERLYKVDMQHCKACNGTGYTSMKPKRICQECNKEGVVYIPIKSIGGLKIVPEAHYATASGFATDKETIQEILTRNINDTARVFLEDITLLNANNTYLNSYINGIQNSLIGDISYPKFNQTATFTGRLSSSNPNFQNQPRGSTFPIKKVIVSRWKGGKILDCDMSQLEFRVAAYLSQDDKAIQDIKDGIDIHSMSASALGITRQEAKAETFAPLYGASRDWGLLKRYPKIASWHGRLLTKAVRDGEIVLPSGRKYLFPHAKRTAWGVTGQTQIKNYPVQGFATADIVPILCIEVYKALKGYKSCLINTVHDSIVVDLFPKEVDIVPKIVYNVMSSAKKYIEERFGYKINVPLECEVSVGDNWLDQQEIEINNN